MTPSTFLENREKLRDEYAKFSADYYRENKKWPTCEVEMDWFFSKHSAILLQLLDMLEEKAQDLYLHTPLKLENTSGREYDKGYIDYQDMVNGQIEEFFALLSSLKEQLTQKV